MRSPRVTLFAAALLACGLVSCGVPHQPAPGRVASEQTVRLTDPELKAGAELQAKLLADGSVSRSDYEQAVEATGDCLTRHDLTFHLEGWDPVANQTIDFTFGNTELAEDVVLGYGDACQETYLGKIQEAYVSSAQPVTDPAILRGAQACLNEHRVHVTGSEENVQDLMDSAGKTGFRNVVDCVTAAAKKLYPNRSIHVGS